VANILQLPVGVLHSGYDERGHWHQPVTERNPLGACRSLLYAIAASTPFWAWVVWMVWR